MLQTKTWFIYALIDPRTNEVRYVGMTHYLRTRYLDHVNGNTTRNNAHRHRWIQQLRVLGLRPIFYLLEMGDAPEWGKAEQLWIAYYRERQAPLTNLTNGGDGVVGLIPTPLSRLRMSLAKKGKPLSEKALQGHKVRALGLKGKKRDPEIGQKISKAKRGFRHTEETKQLIKQKIHALGYRHTEEAKKRMAVAAQGKQHSDATKKKISEAKQGTKPAPHTVAASVASRIGKPLSEAHRQRISMHTRHPQRCGLCKQYGHKRRTCPG